MFAISFVTCMLWLPAGDVLGNPTAVRETAWGASISTGIGAFDGTPAGHVLPRLTYRSQHLDAALASPLWIDVTGAGDLMGPWQRWESYTAWLERLRYRSARGSFSVAVGPLVEYTAGHGSLVDRFSTLPSAWSFGSGMRLTAELWDVESELWTDHWARPRVVGISLHTAPLALLGWDFAERLRVYWNNVVDVDAPSMDGKAWVAGSDIGFGIRLLEGSSWLGEMYLHSVFMSEGQHGMHSGILFEKRWGEAGNKAVSLRIEGVSSSRGYIAGYFDQAYGVERWGHELAGPKMDVKARPGTHFRFRSDWRFDSLRMGIHAEAGPEQGQRTSLYARYVWRDQRFTWWAMNRAIRDATDLVAWDDRQTGMLEWAGPLWRNVHGYTQFYKGWIQRGAGVDPVVSWVMGIGVSAEQG